MQLSDKFKHYWKEIKDALLRIVGHYDPSKVPAFVNVINDQLTSPLTDDDERNKEELKARQVQNLEEKLNVLVQQDEEARLSTEQEITQHTEGNLYPGDSSVVLGLDQSSFLSEKDGNASKIFSYLKTRHTAVFKTSCSSEIPLERRRGIVRDYCSKICKEKKHTKIITREKQEVITYETVSDLQYTFEELGIDIGNVNSSYVKELNSYAKEISEADAVIAYLRQAARKILNRNSRRIHSIIPYHYQGQTAVVIYTYDPTQDLFENDWCEEFLGLSVFVINLMFGYATEPPVLPKPYPTIPSEKQDKLNEIKDEITQKLSKKHSNLSTVAVDYRIKGNKLQEEICLQIGVLTKGIIPLGEEKVFSEIDWVSLDVIESSATLCFHDQTGILGVGIGVQGDNTFTGSLGAIVKHKDTGELFLLSNAHVLHRKGASSSIVHPSLKDYEEDMKMKSQEILRKRCQKLMSIISERISVGASTRSQQDALTRMERQLNRVEEDCKEIAQPRIIATFKSQVNHSKKQKDYLCESHSKKYGIDAAIALIEPDEFNPEYVTKVYEWPRNFKEERGLESVMEITLNGSFKNTIEVEDLLKSSDVVVYKCGGTTGVTRGTLFKEINVRLGCDDSATFMPIFHEIEDGAASKPEVSRLKGPKPELNNMWHNVLHIKSSTVKNARRRDFCADGDSGAVVFDEEGSCVGLLFGRIDTALHPVCGGLATPIHVVFDALNISLASADDFKIDQAQHVGEYVQPLKVPAEVLARGEKAKEAYQRALEEGEVEVYRGRIMLIGQDRAGKTSLKKALLGLTFDPEEPSTVGVDVDQSEFCVDVDNVIDWHIVEGNKKNDFEEYIAKMIAEQIKPEKKKERTKEPEEPEPGLEPQKPKEVHEQPTDDRNEVQDSMDESSLSVEEASIQHEDDDSFNDTVDNGDNAAKSENHDSEMIRTPKKGKEEHETTIPDENLTGGVDVPETVIETVDTSDDATKSENDSETISTPTKGKEEHETTIPDENITGDVDVPETIIETLIKRLKSKSLDEFSSKDKVTVNIWDFAGQHLYYASHPVFFSPRAVYVLVYNLNKDLKAEAELCVRQGVHDIKLDNHEKQTNLEAILSWLVSVHNARPEHDDKKLDYERPPVIIVGTHADCPFETITKMEKIIKESVNEKTYDKHVVRPYITVDNTLSSKDKGVETLKDKIKELFRMEPYMGERVPVRWFKFERVIRSLLEEKTNNYMPLEDLQKVITEVCHIKDQEKITAMLNFYHDLGVIVKHGSTVVLQAEWLIDLFRKLITIRPYDDEKPVHSKHWKNLEKCGILHMDLIEHVFKGIIENRKSTKDDILAMMEHYGLIARFHTADNFNYFVPCQLQSLPGERLDCKPSTSDPCALYFHFTDGFIPHGLYYCLVSKMIAWCSEQGYPRQPTLFKNVSHFFIGDPCQCDLLLICRKRFVKVVLRTHKVEGSLDIQPAFLVRSFLEKCLTDLKDEYLGYRSLTCETSVLCPTCSESDTVCDAHNCYKCRDDDCLHLLPVWKDQVLVCEKTFCKSSRPEEWYRDPSTVAAVPCEESEECGADLSDTVSSTFNLDDNQKRWLVIGISLNKVLLPTLRDFVKPKMANHYDDLKANQNIDNQSYSKHLVNDGKCDKLNYRSINNNAAMKGEKKYDYKVTSAVDLAKLYLQPHMAKFSDFNETCELSAVLGILSSASVFSPDVQDSASNVRQKVRNKWGHCNFQKWDERKFARCFHLMDCLLKTLKLGSDDEKFITDQLQDWENQGVQICMGNKVGIDFIMVIERETDQLSRQFDNRPSSLHDESKIIISALQTIQEAIKEFKEINGKLESTNQRVDKLEQGVYHLDKRVETLESANVVKSNHPSEDNIGEARSSDNEGKGKKSKKQDGKEEKRTSKKSNNSCRCEIA